MYHVIHVVKVWPIEYDWFPIFILALAGLFFLLAMVCGVWLIQIYLELKEMEIKSEKLSNLYE